MAELVGLYLWKYAWIWAPLVLVGLFIHIWVRYVQREFIDNLEFALLEIKIPRDVHKTPLAMEIVLNGLHDASGTGTWYKRWWEGKVRMWFSLEIISIEGSIYFFIRTPVKWKDTVMSYVYSQYPSAEIQHVDDYVRYVPKYLRENEWDMFGTDMRLGKPDGYPIKTYVDYGMDKDLSLDAEQRVDPLTPVLELMATLGPGEQLWMQTIIRAAGKRKGGLLGLLFAPNAGKTWVEEAQDEAKKFRKSALKANIDLIKEINPDTEVNQVRLNKAQEDTVMAIERNITKPGFDTGIRWIYLAQKDKFRGTNISAFLGMFRQFNSPGLNEFKFNLDMMTSFDYPWEDISGRREEMRKERIFDRYMRRAMFYPPWNRHATWFTMNTEELATIFHFPSRTAETPAFERIDSKKAEPPKNLPI